MRRGQPIEWGKLTTRVCDDRARGRCECAGQCGTNHGPRCPARQGHGHPERTGETVYLIPIPRDHVAWHATEENLIAMCQMCRRRFTALEPKTRQEAQEAGLFDLPDPEPDKGKPLL